jgi:uncharacterized alpha/beta hydrolase family protein
VKRYICQLKTNLEPLKKCDKKMPNINASSTIEIKNPNRGGKGTTQERKEKFLKKATEIHKNMYDYSVVDYKNINTKIQIICLEHGGFFQTPPQSFSRKALP